MTVGTTRMASWLRIVCAVLLLSLGLAHKPLYAQPSFAPASSTYVLPDGSFAGLCLGDAGQDQPVKSVWYGCDACRIASGVLFPMPPADHASALRDLRGVVFPVPSVSLDSVAWRPGSPVRGPPFLFA
jgi:hypothetical protein